MEPTLEKKLGAGFCALIVVVTVVLTVNAASQLGELKLPMHGDHDFGGAMPGSEMQGTEAPEFSLEDLDGNTLTLSDYRGKVVLLDFWATWCGPCLKETPTFIALDEQYGEDDLKLIGIAVRDTESEVSSYAAREGIEFSLAMVSDEVQHDYGGINALPTHFLIDRKGVIRYVWMGGPTDLETFQQRIDGLLAE